MAITNKLTLDEMLEQVENSNELITKEEVVALFCALQAEVSHTLERYQTANDCFCSPVFPTEFRNDLDSFFYIKNAVRKKLQKDGYAKR